jgi:hypothetical protein
MIARLDIWRTGQHVQYLSHLGHLSRRLLDFSMRVTPHFGQVYVLTGSSHFFVLQAGQFFGALSPTCAHLCPQRMQMLSILSSFHFGEPQPAQRTVNSEADVHSKLQRLHL